jgi:hypothetical protein
MNSRENTIVDADIEISVTFDSSKKAVSKPELGTVSEDQLAAVFQSPLLRLESHVPSAAVAPDRLSPRNSPKQDISKSR